MKFLLFIIVFSLFVICRCANADSSANTWQIYKNKSCAYQINLPHKNQIQQITENLRTSFYFNPIQFLDDLKSYTAFKNTEIDKNCITQVVFPVQPHTNLTGKFLFIFKLNNAPDQWPPPISNLQPQNQGNLVKIGKNNFYQVNTYDEGMCHSYRYQYYFLKNKNNYYVLEFFFKAHCVGTVANEKEYNIEEESKDFNAISSSFSPLN